MAAEQNIIGKRVRNLRYKQGLTQEMLAARCGRVGWDISRGTLSKIEAQIRCVTDREVTVIAKALRVRIDQLFPPTGTST